MTILIVRKVDRDQAYCILEAEAEGKFTFKKRCSAIVPKISIASTLQTVQTVTDPRIEFGGLKNFCKYPTKFYEALWER
ncbi:MAG: hypothetical protein EAZ78_17195 [Oscillatoriales cyanobacterium]|nr:MAG: hypothetical protein EA000_23280 [Oscillatoriales cyanobacterium]TAD93797.1 MAG: hypothetical protein EAZ98_21465 [Oscillatoriales cyanobacterium]TAE04967.1 MAG: hypothetical protein EAZ96_06995 [Oscillatoriales cyanobacterium]TAF01720.1 MAG: hypothetical protein EAZ78_17195 [Oscillatoriales cyanobacterium]TAF36601.1 MAG: hypothetical protein EAZ68_16335 [Oscillatoriales cyanobacterium]